MRALPLLVVLALAAVSGGVALAGERDDPYFNPRCATQGTTLRDTSRIRIYEAEGSYNACLKPARLFDTLYDYDSNVGRFSGVSTVAGNWVAVIRESASSQGGEASTVAVNLRTHESDANLPYGVALALRPNGDLVIADSYILAPGGTVTLLPKRDSGAGWGRSRTLDRDQEVDPRSLRREADGSITWLHGTQRRTAPRR